MINKMNESAGTKPGLSNNFWSETILLSATASAITMMVDKTAPQIDFFSKKPPVNSLKSEIRPSFPGFTYSIAVSEGA